jgi:hypothetical protein
MINIEQLHEMWRKDSVIDHSALDATSIEGAVLHSKYLELYNVARMDLKKRELKHEELKQTKWRYYTGKMDRDEMDELGWDYDPFNGASKPMKSEMKDYIDADQDVMKSKLKVEYAKVVAEAIEEIISTLRWRHQTIKNIIEFRKFTAGT